MTSKPPHDRDPKATDAEIYTAYVAAKAAESGMNDVLLRFGISRSKLYNVIERVQHGNPGAIKRDIEKARMAALWEHKYKARYLAMPRNREGATIELLKALIKDMHADGFSQLMIAAYLEKDRSTIIHHLEN